MLRCCPRARPDLGTSGVDLGSLWFDLGSLWVLLAWGIPREPRGAAVLVLGASIPRSSGAGHGLRCRFRDLAQWFFCCPCGYLQPGTSVVRAELCLWIDTWEVWAKSRASPGRGLWAHWVRRGPVPGPGARMAACSRTAVGPHVVLPPSSPSPLWGCPLRPPTPMAHPPPGAGAGAGAAAGSGTRLGTGLGHSISVRC